ncbi:MAG: GTPase HflX [Anaerolineae bacterium]|nr:GTPase HflX [Anaerolineae bacterium]
MSKIHKTKAAKPRAYLVGVEFRNNAHKRKAALSLQASLEELALLCDTAGLDVVGQMTQVLDSPNPNTYIGAGKVEELLAWKKAEDFEIVVFDDELSPRHQRELEELLGMGTTLLDRTALILDIFAQHASTREGSLQVELAQYEYRLPRLTRMWTHLARQAGGGAGGAGSGGVGLRGPGETQLEIDRRLIRDRITKLKHDLEKVQQQRAQQRQQRKRSEIPVVAIVGYTNAGKSTLINALTKAGVLAADQLFATLDPTTRRVRLPRGHEILLTDTVGFIQKLPTQLVAAFRATLEETVEADALLHVVDITHPNAAEQAETVMETLDGLGAGNKPMIIALNKADKRSPERIALDENASPEGHSLPEASGILSEGVPVSALKHTGLDHLLSEIESVLFERLIPIKVRLPFKAGDLMSMLRRAGNIESEIPEETGMLIEARIPGRLLDSFKMYLIK